MANCQSITVVLTMPQSSPHAIAAGHPLTVAAAEQVLHSGGNAFDAILAAMMMSFVAEPLLASPGGGGFLLVAGPEQPPRLLDFFSDTPGQPVTDDNRELLDFYPIMGDFGTRSQEFHIGHAAAAVPGVPAGLFMAHQQLCRLPLAELARPAIEAARQGVVVNQQQAFVAMILKPIIQATAESAAVFAGLKAGQRWQNERLADFLDTLSTADHDWFYRGDLVGQMADQPGGLLQAADCAAYQCSVREPLSLQQGEHTILTNPEPSSGGRLILAQLERLKSRSDVLASLEAMQHADDLKRNPLTEVSRGTTHISVTDGAGNLASLTLSNGEGNGQVVSDGGFMMNNFLGEEDINTSGFFNWTSRQRMSSMMAPSLMLGPDSQYALGTGGSNRIKSAMFQVISRLINEQLTLKHAVEAPRMHFENGHLDIEPGFSAAQQSALQQAAPIHSMWHNHNLYFGGVNAVQTGAATAAVGDFRRHGCGVVGFS
jgi:gamma-glutamyltranspeptidase/glutathione hydrolase